MSGVVRWGVCGSGGIARRRTIREGIAAARNAQLVAVYDCDQGINQEVARQFGAAPAENLQDLLTSGIDAIYIATPPQFHFDQAVAAFEAGKHVLCEKPLGRTVAEAESLSTAAKRSGVGLAVAFMMRFQSQHREAQAMIAAGRIGTPVYARAQLSCWYPPRLNDWRQDPARGGGGSLMDMGGHCIDLLEMLLGPVTKVSCLIRNSVQRYEAEDSAVASLWFAGGALATVDTFFCIPDRCSLNVLEIYGSKGSIMGTGTIGQDASGRMIARLESADAGYDPLQARAAGSEIEIAPPPVNPYRAEIEDFGDAILNRRLPLSCGEGGVRSQHILAACYEAAQSGAAVSIDAVVCA